MYDIVYFDTDFYNFKKMFEECLGELEKIHLNYQLKEVEDITSGGVKNPQDNTQYGLIEKLFLEVVHGNELFKQRWNSFLVDVVKKYFDSEKIIVQKLPSIKIFPSNHSWKFVKNPKLKNNRKVNSHFEYEHPFNHPKFEMNFILPITDMDQDNGIFIEDEFLSCKYGELLIFDQVEHGGYVKNISQNTRVSMDFKALNSKNYDKTLLSDTVLCKKRGKWIKQNELFTTENYYKEI